MKFDKKRTNIVLSRKAVLQEQNSEERERLLKVIKEGEKIEGTVKNLTDYGAFVDLVAWTVFYMLLICRGSVSLNQKTF